MLIFKRSVFLRDTDATGVIYFTSLLQYSLEAFELFLQNEKMSLAYLFSKDYLFPVVHAESDYRGPLRVGDEVALHIQLGKITTRSFSVETEVRKLPQGEVVGSTKIIHAFLLKGEKASSEIPQEIISLLKKGLA